MYDLAIVTEGSRISVNPPFIVGGGTAKDSVEAGIAAYTAKTDAEAIAAVREILAYLPSNNEEGGAEVLSGDEVNRHIAAAFGDASSLVKSFADDGKYIELYADYAKSVSVGLISLAGVVCGIAASNPAENEGRLTSAAARKAAKFISFCDCFQIPVITLVDSEGFAVSGDEEKNPFCAEIGKLAGAYAMARTPLITLVSGSAYGSVFSVFGSKAIGADIVFAVDTAKIGCMSAKSAVALLWNDQITKDTTREDLEAKWDAEVASAVSAARAGEIDDIIESAEIRQRLASAVLMLSGKSVAAPRRRHANMPL
jgi:acetyl-CoA carboxylase carboxyltransferase component